ncbi:MAG: lysylphosphatidylglycerol synthase domain-containing protein [Thermoanaerobaculia bacterium]
MESNAPSPHRTVSRLVATAAFAAIALFAVAAVRSAPEGTFAHLSAADPLLLGLGFLAYGTAFFFRGARLNFLLPEGSQIPAAHAWSLSAASLFLVQVVPLRGGELATWAAIRSALGTGWLRSGAVFFAAKLVDTAVLVLAGLAGVAVTLASGRAPAFGNAAGAAAAAGALLLLLAPRLAGGAAGRLAARLPEGSRRGRFAREMAEALLVARERPRRYLAAVAAASACTVLHVVAVSLMLRGLGIEVSPGSVAVALFFSAAASTAIPSPVGNFGPTETGFTAGLALAAVPLPLGLVAAGILHLLSTLSAGLAGLPFLVRHGGRAFSE